MRCASRAASGEVCVVEPAGARSLILVVEDEVLVRLFVADELRFAGYAVIEAADAHEALALIRSDVGIDLMLTDVEMPGVLDGAALARLVRAERPYLKVVIASGHLARHDLVGVADAFLAKPFDTVRLVQQVGTLLA